jgi:hypothetical protein
MDVAGAPPDREPDAAVGGKPDQSAWEEGPLAGPICALCGQPASVVAIGWAVMWAYLELCEEHLANLLLNARPVEERSASASPGIAPKV